jgi:hypothetical protein
MFSGVAYQELEVLHPSPTRARRHNQRGSPRPALVPTAARLLADDRVVPGKAVRLVELKESTGDATLSLYRWHVSRLLLPQRQRQGINYPAVARPSLVSSFPRRDIALVTHTRPPALYCRWRSRSTIGRRDSTSTPGR